MILACNWPSLAAQPHLHQRRGAPQPLSHGNHRLLAHAATPANRPTARSGPFLALPPSPTRRRQRELKVLVVGDGGVGKSSFIKRFCR